jgi:drug/metabolite transporter (DMT)-like permease
MPAKTIYFSYGALSAAALVWGGSIVAQKLALEWFSVVEVSVLRGAGALLLLIPLWWWREGGQAKVSLGEAGILAALGLGVLGNHLLTLIGLRYIGAGAAGVIIGAGPAITAFLSSLLIRDVPFGRVWVGCAVSFAGVALVSSGGDLGRVGQQPWAGALLIVLGLVSWAFYSIGSRQMMERRSPLTVNWTTLCFSTLLQVPLLWTDTRAMSGGMDAVPSSGWMALVYLIIFATAFGQQAWLYGVQGVGPARAGIFINLIPVSALVFSMFVLGEPIGVKEVAGILLILAGVWQVTRERK